MFFKNRQTEKDVFKENLDLISKKDKDQKLQTIIAREEYNVARKDHEDHNNEERMKVLKNMPTQQDNTKYNLRKAKMSYNINMPSIKDKETHKAKQLERYSFFPFTEGEGVEERRAMDKIKLTKELREDKKFNQPKTASVSQRIRSRGSANSFNRTNGLSPLSKVNMEDVISNNGNLGNTNLSFNQNGQREPPDSFLTSYPKFLEPHKFHPYRRLNDSHIEKVMNDAVQRVEDQVQNIKDLRAKRSQDFNDQMRVIMKRVEKEHFQKQKDEQTLQEYHQAQIRTKEVIKNSEDKKAQENAYYGPKSKGYINYNNEFKDAKNKREAEILLRNEQKRQIEEQRRALSMFKYKERLQDVENLWVAGKMMMKENKEAAQKNKQSKQMYKDLWKEQMKINNIKALHLDL